MITQNGGSRRFMEGPVILGPREMNAAGRLFNIFSIAMPGQDFKEYTRGWLVKK